jgi:hypothetical protein
MTSIGVFTSPKHTNPAFAIDMATPRLTVILETATRCNVSISDHFRQVLLAPFTQGW